MQEYKIVRLTTKELIICKLVAQENASEIIMENPYEVKSFLNPTNGEFNSTLVDWLQFSNEKFTTVDTFNVMTMNNPEPSLLSYYEELLEKKSGIDKKRIEKVEPKDNQNEELLEDYVKLLANNKVYH